MYVLFFKIISDRFYTTKLNTNLCTRNGNFNATSSNFKHNYSFKTEASDINVIQKDIPS